MTGFPLIGDNPVVNGAVSPLSGALFDVVAVNIETGARRLIAERKSRANADAIVCMAVMRRGVEQEFFIAEPHPAQNVSGAAA